MAPGAGSIGGAGGDGGDGGSYGAAGASGGGGFGAGAGGVGAVGNGGLSGLAGGNGGNGAGGSSQGTGGAGGKGGAGGNGSAGGAGGAGGGGGGGLGAGGAIFVQSGGKLTYAGGSLSSGTATGGLGGKAGGAGAGDGQGGEGYGAGIFIMGDEHITLAPATGKTLTISSQISDQSGSDPTNAYHVPGAGGVVVKGAGTVDLATGNNFTGGITLDAGTLLLGAVGAAGSGAIQFAGSTAPTLEFSKADAPTVAIDDFFVGDEIKINGFTTASHSYAGGSLSLSGSNGGVSLKIAGLNDDDFQITNSGDDTFIVSSANPCYARGTLILTDRGETPVEALRVGDRVATVSGEAKPIKWIGHRRLDLTRHPRPEEVWPVRVAAGAFGEDLPRRDLWLSPRHAIAAEGALIPIVALLNGASVRQARTAAVEYWHVELDAHDVIFAEGLLAESYLDNGNRAAFANGAAFVEAHPDFKPRHWRETCLPLVEDGPEVVLTRKRLIERIEGLGYSHSDDADPHILADGHRIEPVRLGETRIGFALPAGCRSVTLASQTFVPSHMSPDSADLRELGLCVKRLSVDGEDVPLDADELAGWNEVEQDCGDFSHRWTRGAAPLAAGARFVVVDLAGCGRFWRAPHAAGPRALPVIRVAGEREIRGR